MTEKSKLQQDLEGLTAEQFAAANSAFEAAKAARGNNEEYRRKVSSMTEADFQNHVSEVSR